MYCMKFYTDQSFEARIIMSIPLIIDNNVVEIASAVVGTALLMIMIALAGICGVYVYKRSVKRKRG